MAHADVACGVPSGDAIDQRRWIVFQDESGTALTKISLTYNSDGQISTELRYSATTACFRWFPPWAR